MSSVGRWKNTTQIATRLARTRFAACSCHHRQQPSMAPQNSPGRLLPAPPPAWLPTSPWSFQVPVLWPGLSGLHLDVALKHLGTRWTCLQASLAGAGSTQHVRNLVEASLGALAWRRCRYVSRVLIPAAFLQKFLRIATFSCFFFKLWPL